MADSKFQISSYVTEKVTGIVLKNPHGAVHPETDLKRIVGLQSLLSDIEAAITASQAAATTVVVPGTGIVLNSKIDESSRSTTYTVSLGTALDANKNTAGIYKVTADEYGRVTALTTPTSEEVLALNSGSDKSKNIATQEEVENAIATAKAALSQVQEGTGIKVTPNKNNTTGSTTYTVTLSTTLASASALGIHKIAVDTYGRVTEVGTLTQADVLALSSNNNANTAIATVGDVNKVAENVNNLLDANNSALHYVGNVTISTEESNIALTSDGNNTVDNANIAKLLTIKGNGTKKVLENGDTFVVGNLNNKTLTVDGVAAEQGDMIIVATHGERNRFSLHVIQTNIDGAVTATTAFTSVTGDGIVVVPDTAGGGRALKAVTLDTLGVARIGDVAEGHILIGTSSTEIQDSGVAISAVVTAGDNLEAGVPLFTKNSKNIASTVSGKKGQVLTVNDSGAIAFADHNTNVKLEGADNKITLKTGKNGEEATTNAGSIEFGTGSANVNVAVSGNKVTVSHTAAGVATSTVVPEGTTTNGGSIKVPQISIDSFGHVVSVSNKEISTPTFSEGTGITVNGTTISLSDVARTNGTDTGETPAFGGTATVVSSVTTNAQGQVTGVKTKTVTIPSLPNYKVVGVTTTEGDNEYVKIAGTDAAGTDKTLKISNIQIGTQTIKFDEGSTITKNYYTGKAATAGTADNVAHKLSIANKDFTGASEITITAGTGITFGDGSILLGTVLDFGKNDEVTIVETTALGTAAMRNGGPLTIPKYTVDIYGRVTAIDSQDIQLPGVGVNVGGTPYELPVVGDTMNIPFGAGFIVQDNKICADLTYEVISE